MAPQAWLDYVQWAAQPDGVVSVWFSELPLSQWERPGAAPEGWEQVGGWKRLE